MIVSGLVNIEIFLRDSYLNQSDPIASFTYTNSPPLPRIGETIYFDKVEYLVVGIGHCYLKSEAETNAEIAIAVVVDKISK